MKMQQGSRGTAGLPDRWPWKASWHAHRVFWNMHFITARTDGEKGSVFQMHLHHLPAILEPGRAGQGSHASGPHLHKGWTWVHSSAHRQFAGRSLPLEAGLVLRISLKDELFPSPLSHQNHSPAALSFPAQRHLALCSILLPALLNPPVFHPLLPKSCCPGPSPWIRSPRSHASFSVLLSISDNSHLR